MLRYSMPAGSGTSLFHGFRTRIPRSFRGKNAAYSTYLLPACLSMYPLSMDTLSNWGEASPGLHVAEQVGSVDARMSEPDS